MTISDEEVEDVGPLSEAIFLSLKPFDGVRLEVVLGGIGATLTSLLSALPVEEQHEMIDWLADGAHQVINNRNAN